MVDLLKDIGFDTCEPLARFQFLQFCLELLARFRVMCRFLGLSTSFKGAHDGTN
jgi:hypothetical protein